MMSLDKYCYSWNCVANIKIFIRRTINFDSGSEFTDKGHICKFATKALSLRYATCATIIMAYYNFSVLPNCNDYKLQWRCTGRRLTFLRIQFRPSRRLFFFSRSIDLEFISRQIHCKCKSFKSTKWTCTYKRSDHFKWKSIDFVNGSFEFKQI